MGTGRRYGEEFKKEAVKLAKEIGNKEAAEELDVPRGTLGTWVRLRLIIVMAVIQKNYFPN